MAVTRGKDYPPEAAALVDAFSRCSDGNSMLIVLDAAANFFVMSMHNSAKARGLSLAQAESNARRICKSMIADLAVQWNRTPLPTDIKVDQN